jgi:hypothetical protein
MNHIHLEIFGALCSTRVFTINGIAAAYDDFGEKYDRSPDTAEEYGCGNMQFTGIPSTPEVLAKYGIDQETYDSVVEQLDGLSFGSCGWCV